MLKNYLPQFINKRLFGDRNKFLGRFDKNDPDWLEWEKFYLKFYTSTQKEGAGSVVNNWGYKILNKIDMESKTVFEIGPGNLPHMSFWNNAPKKYIVADIDQKFIDASVKKFEVNKIEYETHLVKRSQFAEIPDNSIDIVLTFYSLEHMSNLPELLDFFKAKLKKNGVLVGAIPNEGGLAWGLGRFLTSRRFVHQNSNINYDKIICWEHPNDCDYVFNEFIKAGFTFNIFQGYPFGKYMPYDTNLISAFVCKIK